VRGRNGKKGLKDGMEKSELEEGKGTQKGRDERNGRMD
jgi:hypothetical protein